MPKFVLLVYTDPALMGELQPAEFNGMMRDCLAHADAETLEGRLLGFQQLEGPETARSVRIRNGKASALDGPFAEAKEVLGGFNLIEAENIDEAVQWAMQIPFARTGCIEVRPVRDIGAVRRQVGAPEAPEVAAR